MRLRDSVRSTARALTQSPRARRLLRAAAIASALCVLSWIGLHLALNSAPVRSRLLSEVRERLDERLLQVELGDGLAVDWLFRVTLGPIRIRDGARAVVEIGQLRVRPRYSAALHGHLEPATISIKDVRIDLSDRGEGLRRWWAGLRRGRRGSSKAAGEAEARPLVLRVEDAVVLAPGRGSGAPGAPAEPLAPVELGPVSGELRVVPADGGRLVRASLSLPGDARARAEVSLSREGLSRAELSVEGLTPATLPEELQASLPFRITRGLGSAQLQLGREARGPWALHLEAQLKELTVSGERLASAPVGPFAISAKADVQLELARRRVVLSSLDVFLGPGAEVALHATADAQLSGELPFHLKTELKPCESDALLAALPAELHPPPEVPRLPGPLGATAQFSGELRHPEAMEVQVNLALAALRKSARATKVFLTEPFPYKPESSTRELWVGESNPAFVPLAQLPLWVSRAVTMSEDAGFFAHQGFDFDEMRQSVVSAIEEKRVRGASTITQQLCKNLFLSKERTLSRKVREALTTVALEATVPKARLLEIYLNIIEWGPGLYGIGEAAPYYFGKDPRQLSVKEAAFLATIIPNPVRYHVYFERGALTDNWERRVIDLLTRMREEGMITQEQLDEAATTPLTFRVRTEGDAGVLPHANRDERTAPPGATGAP